MKLATRTEVVATTEVKLEPALKTKLQQRLRLYKQLKADFEAARAKMEKEKLNIDGYFEQAGAQSIEIDGVAKLTEVRGVSSTLDKKLFVQNGGSLKMLEDSTITKPKRPYVLVTFAEEGE